MNVLFVDDEAQVLRGLERALDAAEIPWTTFFAESGARALELLAVHQFDAIVTDMRMPQMDGAELLERIARQQPSAVRVVLSGQATKDAVYRAVSPMHQYLAKPCEVSQLCGVLKKSLALREMLHCPRLAGFVGKISKLPSTPEVYDRLVEELSSEDYTAATIGAIVALDPAMTAKLLQIVNSVVFGLSRTVASVEHAVAILGADTVKALVLSVGVFSEFDQLSIPGICTRYIAEHCLVVGKTAEKIAQLEGGSQDFINVAFTAGLLHDIGKLILALEAPSEYAIAFERCRREQLALTDVEREMFGASHPAIGAYLLGLWGLPQSLIEAVAMHHAPQLGDTVFSPITAVAAANLLVNRRSVEHEGSNEAILAHLAEIGFEQKLLEWNTKCFSINS